MSFTNSPFLKNRSGMKRSGSSKFFGSCITAVKDAGNDENYKAEISTLKRRVFFNQHAINNDIRTSSVHETVDNWIQSLTLEQN